MNILAVILIVTGVVLMFVGTNLANHLPPNYQSEDDDFLQLLLTMGNSDRTEPLTLIGPPGTEKAD